jgi:hypothetical protein
LFVCFSGGCFNSSSIFDVVILSGSMFAGGGGVGGSVVNESLELREYYIIFRSEH